MKIEEVIKKRGKEEFYNFYLGLGYDKKTAAALALFTYGQYSFGRFSMDELYEALCKGEEYLPPEELERRRIQKERIKRSRRIMGLRKAIFSDGEIDGAHLPESTKAMPAPAISAPTVPPQPLSTMPESPMPTGLDTDLEADSSTLDMLGEFEFALADCASEPMVSEASVAASEMSLSMPLSAPSIMPSVAAQSLVTGLDSFASLAGQVGFATDEYETIEEKDARSTAAEPTSTFRMTTNTASAGVILNQLRNERRIDRSMVRIEEMLNYFRYDSELPQKEMFSISTEVMDADKDRKYLYINVQGREEVKEKQNIIILLDTSGSMHGNAKYTQAVIAAIVSKLGKGDRISLVTYSDSDHVELEAFAVNGEKDRISVLEKLLSIWISGFTYGSAGIEKAYEIGKKNFIEGGNNQVILITDGDLNFGITDKGGLEELIERKKKDNLFLSVIGTGLWNYKDDKLEALCKHGNGVYRTVNSLTDVKKSIDEEYSSLVNIIAKDVKAQVEFNPEVVESYRLLGFENRTLAREDFTNDKVISEPFGSGGYGVALYELNMKTGTEPVDSGLKYSKIVTTGSGELGSVKVRYKEPLEDVSHELEKVIESPAASYTDNLRLAFIVYTCAEKLRASDKISTEEIDLAKKLYKELGSKVRERNSADLYKLAGILDKSEKELGIGLSEEPFLW